MGGFMATVLVLAGDETLLIVDDYVVGEQVEESGLALELGPRSA